MWSCYLPTCSSPILKHWKSYSVRANGRWVPQSIQIVGFMRSLVYLSTSITSVYAWTFCSHTLMIIHAVRSTFYKHTHTCTHIHRQGQSTANMCDGTTVNSRTDSQKTQSLQGSNCGTELLFFICHCLHKWHNRWLQLSSLQLHHTPGHKGSYMYICMHM